MKVWIHCLDSREMEAELKGRIIRVKTQIKYFELYFGLHPGTWRYSHIDNLARSVQNKGVSACSSKRLANLAIQTLEILRNEERYENLYETVLMTAKLHQFVNPPTLKRKQRAPNYSTLQFVEVHINLRKHTVLVHLKKTIIQFTMRPWIVWLTHWKNDLHSHRLWRMTCLLKFIFIKIPQRWTYWKWKKVYWHHV